MRLVQDKARTCCNPITQVSKLGEDIEMLKTNLEMMEKDEEDFFCQSAGKSYNTNTMVEIFSGRSETVSTNLE